MYVTVEGVNSARTAKLIEDVIQYAKDQLMSNIRKLFIDVEVIDGYVYQEGINGETIYDGNGRHVTIAIDPNQPLQEFITTLLHEMVHVKQYIAGELKDSSWKGEYFEGSYKDSPWEKEAYRLESVLLEGFLAKKRLILSSVPL